MKRFRYRGGIAPLHDLSTALHDHEFAFDLAPGPSPDVTVLVYSHQRPAGVARLEWVLDAWRARNPRAVLDDLDGLQ